MSSIEWTDETWNPVRGCSIVSKGCTNCYAMKQAHRFSGAGGPYEGLTKLTAGGPVWTGKVALVPEQLAAPLHWRKPRRVFVNSMSDLFHEDVPDWFIVEAFAVMECARQHTFQILTKRPLRMKQFMASASGYVRKMCIDRYIQHWKGSVWPPRNVWLGVSVEDKPTADERVPPLLQTPAAVRFLSCEPLLGPLLLDDGCKSWLSCSGKRDSEGGCCFSDYKGRGHFRGIDWVIAGGESGPGARPSDVAWAHSVVAQCKDAGVAVFVKQLGAHVTWNGCSGPGEHWPDGTEIIERLDGGWRVILRDRKGGDMDEWPEDLRVREFPRGLIA